MKQLHISENFGLPLSAVTEALVIYGGRGQGKTNLAAVLAEEFAASSLRFCVVDPMGVFWGLRYDADGKGPGVPVLILGGQHGDIPIEPTSGAVCADLVADEDADVILDVSRHPNGAMWSVGERIRFVGEFTRRFYQRQGERRRPIMLVIDEAGRYVPEQIRSGDIDAAKTFNAVATLVEEGRNVGVGVMLITQRSARMSKAVSELASCMIAFNTIGPRSIAAIVDWLGEHIEKKRAGEVIQIIRTLPVGSAMLVSPAWLKHEGVVAMRSRRTFDSSATPKPGETVRARGKGAEIDLSKYVERMQETIERAKADDPRELKKRIAELERRLKQPLGVMAKTAKADPKAVERAVAKAIAERDREWGAKGKAVSAIRSELAKTGLVLTTLVNKMADLDEQFRETAKEVRPRPDLDIHVSPPSHKFFIPPSILHTRVKNLQPMSDNHDLSGPERRILKALGELVSIGKETPPKNMVAAWSGYSPLGGAFANPMGALRTKGLIEYPQPGTVILTNQGRATIGPCEPPDRAEVIRRINSTCTGPERKILGALLNSGQEEMSKENLAGASGYSPVGGAFANPVGALRTKGLIDYPRPGVVKAADWLTEYLT